MAHDILKCHQSRTNDFVPYDMHKRFEDWSYNSIDMLMGKHSDRYARHNNPTFCDHYTGQLH